MPTRHQLDLSSVQIDGSHTPAKNGGDAVGYQGRKSCKTSNSLFLCDNSGQMLSVSRPQSGEHNDLYDIAAMFEELLSVLESAKIQSKWVFINADPGFDSETFKAACAENQMELNVKPNTRNKKVADEYQYFDEQLYKRRTKIEPANAWMDSFKALLIRFETKVFT